MDQLPPPEEEMKALLNFVSKNEASDLHLKAGYPPYIRIGGHLRKIQGPPLPDEGYIEQMLTPLVLIVIAVICLAIFAELTRIGNKVCK